MDYIRKHTDIHYITSCDRKIENSSFVCIAVLQTFLYQHHAYFLWWIFNQMFKKIQLFFRNSNPIQLSKRFLKFACQKKKKVFLCPSRNTGHSKSFLIKKIVVSRHQKHFLADHGSVWCGLYGTLCTALVHVEI